MDNPATPQRQVAPTTQGQQLTPPSSIVHGLTHSTPMINGGTEEGENSAPILREDGARQLLPESGQIQHSQVQHRQESEGAEQQFEMHSRPKSDIASWLYGSASPEQRRRRFNSFLHGLWPSNDEFNAARHPFYDPEEDGPYDDFIKYQEWEGVCPYDDDEYNPLTDPSKTTEVWEPKIGEEGIEDEQDLRMVLKARREHRARSKALKRLRGLGITLVSLSLETNSNGSGSVSGYGNGEDMDGPESAVKMEALSQIPSPPPCKSMIQTTTLAKGIVVFGAQGPSSNRVQRPRKRSKKKGRKSNKRKQGRKEDPNGTYKYNSGSEDEQLAFKKNKSKSKAATGNAPWKAQTRAAARRAGSMGMDGSCDIDSDSSTAAAITGSSGESDEDEPKKGPSSRIASSIAH
ncbi:hypothetical protein F4824DRAFT_509848 [Ustulina deusta]|nr:hypothetical protein F4824DRAFT_509848 [Ustulina deusta]